MTGQELSRRKFIETTISSTIAVPALVSIGGFSNAFGNSPLTVPAPSLCLFEANVIPRDTWEQLEDLGHEKQSISLETGTDWLELTSAIDHAKNQALIILGRPATVFTIKTVLGTQWHVAIEGSHHKEALGTRHELTGIAASIGPLKKLGAARLADPLGYVTALANTIRPNVEIDNNQIRRTHQTATWSDNDLSSILAWPRRGTA